jgi:hypothetical protein
MRIASLLLSFTLASSAFAGEIFIPATFRGPGAAGSVWRTEISVSNITNSIHALPVPVTIAFHRNESTAAPVTIHTPLAPMEVLSIPDALHSWFDVEEGGGVVRITWDDPTARITGNARIYNLSSDGEYGQGVPGVRADRMVSDVFLPGISGINGNRTNIGVFNPHNTHELFWVTLYDTSGLSRGAFATFVAPRSYRQFNDIFSHFQAGPLGAAMIRVTATNNTIYAYASVVRNDTGDATFITPAE